MSVKVAGVADLRTDLVTPAEWAAYTDATSVCGLFHRHEWERVFRVYRLPYLLLGALREDRVVGVCPLVPMTSRIFGNQAVSLPWFDAAGVVADDVAARDVLVTAARDIARQRKSSLVQLRSEQEAPLSPYVRTDKVLMRLHLEETADRLWTRLSPKVRNQVRKAEKNGLEVHSGGDLCAEFFGVYSENMRDLGSPSHSQRFFAAVEQAFAEEVKVYVVRQGGETIGAGWTMSNGAALEIPWASSLRRYGRLCVNHLLYWTILADACNAGFETFHFGRSTRGSGTYHFKKQWGAEAIQLYWHLVPVAGGVPDTSPAQEGYTWAANLWRRLPLWVARRAGPRVIAQVP